jgi:hypothetical protein
MHLFKTLISIGLFLVSLSTVAAVNSNASQMFIEQTVGKSATPKIYWLTEQDKATIEQILQHSFNRLRIRYWQKDDSTVWLLDEIGKEQLISFGVYIKNHSIEEIKVLVYRESRGDEIKHRFFTEQFHQATLLDNGQLSQHIDGITGATLSVNAMKKIARLALYLDKKVTEKH